MDRRDSTSSGLYSRSSQPRRFSEPAPTKYVINKTDDCLKPFRRYSFSVLEDIQSFKANQVQLVDLKAINKVDLTPAGVRSRVERVLQDNGFKDAERAKIAQHRRYSTFVDPNVVNNLGPSERRGSFGAAVLERSEAFSKTGKRHSVQGLGNDKTSHDTTSTVTKADDKRHSIGSGGPTNYLHSHNQITHKQSRIAWANTHDADEKAEQPNVFGEEHFPSAYLLSATNSHPKEADESLQQKKDMWDGRCRRDSLSTLRNSVIESLRPTLETSTEYWRRCRSLRNDDSVSKFPKCKYRLRGDGLIASELANATRVDIYEAVPDDEPRDDYFRNKPLTTSALCLRPESSAHVDKTDVLRQLMKHRKRGKSAGFCSSQRSVQRRPSSSFSDTRSVHTAEFTQTSPVRYSPRPMSRSSTHSHLTRPPSSASSNTRETIQFATNLKRQNVDQQCSKPSRPKTLKRQFTLSNFKHISALSQVTQDNQNIYNKTNHMKPTPTQKRRWSQTPTESFELIGSTALHGRPGCNGRLMLLTARTVRFNEEFQNAQ